MKQSLPFTLLILSSASAFAPSHIAPSRQPCSLHMTSDTSSRRQAFSKIIGGIALVQPLVSNALDFDAFINSELDSDTKNCDPKKDPKCVTQLSADEATCKYAQGAAKSAACKRLKEAGKEVPKQAQGKSLGGAYAM